MKRSGVLAPPGNALGRREVDFYRYARQRSDRALPVPICSEASYDDGGGGRLVLERACWRTPRILSDEDALIVGDVIESGVVPALARFAHRTLTHADLHVDNVLFRTRGDAVEAVVIDWQLYESGIGPCDLAHLLVSGLEPPDRRSAEDVLVHRYHAGLVAGGVRDYALDARLAGNFAPSASG